MTHDPRFVTTILSRAREAGFGQIRTRELRNSAQFRQ